MHWLLNSSGEKAWVQAELTRAGCCSSSVSSNIILMENFKKMKKKCGRYKKRKFVFPWYTNKKNSLQPGLASLEGVVSPGTVNHFPRPPVIPLGVRDVTAVRAVGGVPASAMLPRAVLEGVGKENFKGYEPGGLGKTRFVLPDVSFSREVMAAGCGWHVERGLAGPAWLRGWGRGQLRSAWPHKTYAREATPTPGRLRVCFHYDELHSSCKAITLL